MANLDRLPLEQQIEVLKNQNQDLTKKLGKTDLKNEQLEREIRTQRVKYHALTVELQTLLRQYEQDMTRLENETDGIN